MADHDQHLVSSTSSFLNDEVHHYQAEPEPQAQPGPRDDLYAVDDIVDLVGGAQDALERHRAEDSTAQEEPGTVRVLDPEPEPEEEPVPEPKPVLHNLLDPEPVPEPALFKALDPETEPVKVSDPEPEQVKLLQTEPDPVPDTTTTGPLVLEHPAVTAPKAEPENTQITAPAVEPPATRPADTPGERAPSPAAAVERRPATEDASAPAYCPSSSSPAHLRPLMQFPTALGQEGISPAPVSPLSPLHSPDSLEELSLTESPNPPPTSGPAITLASSFTDPASTVEHDEGDPGPGRNKNTELMEPLASAYLSLGKHNPCDDSGVSVSPEEKLVSSGPSPVNPPMSHPPSSNPTELWDTPFLTSQDKSKVSMDSFPKDSSPYEPERVGDQSDEDDDLMYETKNNNPFDGFSPLADSGYSHFGESKSDGSATKISESPNPDLVQYGLTAESEDCPPSFLQEEKTSQSGQTLSDSLLQSVNPLSTGLKYDEEEEEDSVLPPSLPDILKSSPLNPEKVDSGSSEGSPEDQSPILERRMMESPNPPINLSANNPFAFDAKVSLLKEMADEMEVKIADKGKAAEEKIFGAFDLVKEAEVIPPLRVKQEEPVKIEQKDWFSCSDSPKMLEKFEPLDFNNKKKNEDSDSESPTADSLSPVLEAMAKNPTSFQVETQKKDLKMEEPEMAEEVSEHEVSSEEFEFIERPPRGVVDDFLEALDSSKFASSKLPELPLDEDLSFGLKDSTKASPVIHKEAPSQSSYLLLTQATPQRSKAELETLQALHATPHIHDPTPTCKADEMVVTKSGEGGIRFKMPSLNPTKVRDLLYWRDVKATGVVFGAALLLLLSLTVCSIVSVSSYIGLALLSVTVTFRIYRGVLQAVQKSDEGHPFRHYLDQEVALSEDTLHKYSDAALDKVNRVITELRHLFLVEDLVDSIKFAGLMWILTYVGALFNGLTVLILGLIAAFSCPIIYEKHQAQIDHYLSMVNKQIKDIVGKIQATVPGMKRKAE
ncbi:reticulon-4a isoform X1 [Gouania willdenowi]|uniref:reticulon-4a isoform X1 n=1 Tax=Gouania willdenowi TaxID=441366 RepID=UPI001054DEFA|nr:reticulon-1-like isoform X1 [Gouania willdenowi]